MKCKYLKWNPPHALKINFTERINSTPLTLYRPKGCPSCQGVGYWVRRGIYELLAMSEELKQLIHGGGTQEQIRTLAKSQGMQTLRECGLDFVYQGVTTVEEVFRSTGE